MNKYLNILLFFLLIFHLVGCRQPTDYSYTNFNIIPLEDIEITSGTGEKPQSKVWFHDEYWWAILQEDIMSPFFKAAECDLLELPNTRNEAYKEAFKKANDLINKI